MRLVFTIMLFMITLSSLINANKKDTCQITKTYSCDEYESSLISKISAFGKQGPRGKPGKDCNMTMLLKTREENVKLKKNLVEISQALETLKSDFEEVYRKNLRDKFHKKPRDCYDIKKLNVTSQSGVYRIHGVFSRPEGFLVYCDQETDGGGWTVFQKRTEGVEDFVQNWDSFDKGFGNVFAEFWLGLNKLREITQVGKFELRIDLEDFERRKAYALYKGFSIGDSPDYQLRFNNDSYTGNAGDGLSYHHNQKFSTYDNDQDLSEEGNCADRFKSGWWHKHCHQSSLNGLYLHGETDQFATGIIWKPFRGYYYALKATSMKFRPMYAN